MLLIHCPRHRSHVLVTERRIRSLRNTKTGISLTVECWCGRYVTIRTGRPYERPTEHPREPAAPPATGVCGRV